MQEITRKEFSEAILSRFVKEAPEAWSYIRRQLDAIIMLSGKTWESQEEAQLSEVAIEALIDQMQRSLMDYSRFLNDLSADIVELHSWITELLPAAEKKEEEQ